MVRRTAGFRWGAGDAVGFEGGVRVSGLGGAFPSGLSSFCLSLLLGCLCLL